MKKYVFIYLLCILTLLLTSPARAYDHPHDDGEVCIKCGTPEIMRQLSLGVFKIAQRPDMEVSIVLSGGHFRVHYDSTGYHAPDPADDNGNGIPDYVDSTLVYLEYAWDLIINQLGYPEPLSDNGRGGGNEVDVYIRQLKNTYGYTQPDNAFSTSTSAYIEIDNDFAEDVFKTHGYEALKVTTAHEFFHTIHFRYYYDMQMNWWMEHTSVWMEDRAWDDVNDYIHYLYLFFDENEIPLDSNNYFKYGATIWAHYLAKRFGDDIIKDIWEVVSEEQTYRIDPFDEVIPIGLGNAYGEFAAWNYFTGSRGNTVDFYPDSDIFDEMVTLDGSAKISPAEDSLYTRYLTSRYVELLFVGDWQETDTLRVHITPLNYGSFVTSVIFYNDPYDYRIDTVDTGISNLSFGKSWNRAVLVTSCTKTSGVRYDYSFEAEVIKGEVGVEEEPLYAFDVHGTYPNPFNPSTTLSFSLPESGEVTVQVFNALGQKVDDLFTGRLTAGEKRLFWQPSGLSGGLYLIRITTPWGMKTVKTLLLK